MDNVGNFEIDGYHFTPEGRQKSDGSFIGVACIVRAPGFDAEFKPARELKMPKSSARLEDAIGDVRNYVECLIRTGALKVMMQNWAPSAH